MGYDKVKYIAVKGNKVFITSADGRTVPTQYERWEVFANTPMTAQEKMRKIGISIAGGSYQPLKSAKCRGVNLYRLADCMSALMEQQKHTSFQEDFKWKENRWQELMELVVDLMFLPNIFGNEQNPAKIVNALSDFDKESERVYQKKAEQFVAEDKLPIRCAWRSSVFAGYDILIDYMDQMILAKAENYHTGLLNNLSEAIDIGPYDSTMAAHFIDGTKSQLADVTLDEYLESGGKPINFKKLAGLTMAAPMFRGMEALPVA